MTISSRFLTDSKTLSSKTVVNSCSMLVNKTVILSESKFNYFLKSWPKLNLSSLGRNSVSYKILRILVSIWFIIKTYLTFLQILGIIQSLLEIFQNLSWSIRSPLVEQSIVVIVLGVFDVDGVFVADTESSSYYLSEHFMILINIIFTLEFIISAFFYNKEMVNILYFN